LAWSFCVASQPAIGLLLRSHNRRRNLLLNRNLQIKRNLQARRLLPRPRRRLLSTKAPLQKAPRRRTRLQKNTSTKKKSSSSVAARAKRKRSSPRMRRMHEAFVASTTLKPMARQLLQDRTPAAYTGRGGICASSRQGRRRIARVACRRLRAYCGSRLCEGDRSLESRQAARRAIWEITLISISELLITRPDDWRRQ